MSDKIIQVIFYKLGNRKIQNDLFSQEDIVSIANMSKKVIEYAQENFWEVYHQWSKGGSDVKVIGIDEDTFDLLLEKLKEEFIPYDVNRNESLCIVGPTFEFYLNEIMEDNLEMVA